MKIYDFYGYMIIVIYALSCASFAPAQIGPFLGLLIGAGYFILCWFFGGLYLSDIIHLGIAHRSLDYKVWFIKAVTIVNNTFFFFFRKTLKVVDW